MDTIQNKIDTQILNNIKAISAQITATNNPAELSRLAIRVQSLKSDNQFII
ncbi:MAG: hypothetical protein RCO49_01305 [Rickettsia endosymbiont of Argas persicus]